MTVKVTKPIGRLISCPPMVRADDNRMDQRMV
jgi:hypothetical protein